MEEKLTPLVLAGVLLATFTGCPSRVSEGGGGGPAGPALSQPTALTGDQLAFARAYARAPWVVANLGAGDWSRALRDVTYLQDQIVSMKRSAALQAKPRLAIAGLQPKTDELALLVQQRDTAAIPLAASLVEDFSHVAVQLSDSGWLSAGWGGGAGRGAGGPQGAPAPPPRPS